MVFSRFVSLSLLAAALATLGCHAQQPAPGASATPAGASMTTGTPLSPEMAWRIESMLRQKADLPPEATVHISGRTPSEFQNFDTVTVTVSAEGRTSRPIVFLLSRDGKTLAQITKFDISADPRTLVSGAGRPARGGGENAPVQIVEFDDLECPFCAKLHNSLFPAITERYGDKVRIVYKDFPLDQHPWATHAAVDANCLADQSGAAYWADVDYVHGHASDFGADPKDPKADKTLARATEQLDKLTRDQGETRKLDMPKLNACIAKQDVAGIEASKKIGLDLGVGSTPSLFINGVKIDGAVSLDYLFGIIDQALRVAGVQPPPPYVAPKPAASTTSPATPGR